MRQTLLSKSGGQSLLRTQQLCFPILFLLETTVFLLKSEQVPLCSGRCLQPLSCALLTLGSRTTETFAADQLSAQHSLLSPEQTFGKKVRKTASANWCSLFLSPDVVPNKDYELELIGMPNDSSLTKVTTFLGLQVHGTHYSRADV